MATFYPLKLNYITKSPIWGGRRLMDGWGLSADAETVGEAWMLTVRAKEMSVIQNGALAGKTMLDLINEHGGPVAGNPVIGTAFTGGDFPLLIKLIDACDKLSVQVHPNDDYAARVEHDRGKTEMWYIVEADEGAEIIYGLRDGMSAEEFRRAVKEGKLSETMRRCPVHAGETYFIPSGMLHAIGAGILIAEIQQNCDLTYRVYDYDRRQPDGSLRQLHVEKALDVTVPFTDREITDIRFERGEEDPGTLAHCRYFRTRKLMVKENLTLDVTPASFAFVLCTEGNGTLTYDGKTYDVRRGDGYYLPAGMGNVRFSGDAVCLVASID